MRIRTLISGALIFSTGHLAIATSVLVRLKTRKIVIAADTHVVRISPSFKSEDDLSCKITVLGRFAFAQSGQIDYAPTASDTLPAWKSQSDAEAASSANPDDLVATADAWAARARNHFKSLYVAVPQRFQAFMGKGPQLLLDGLFVGFKDGTPTMVGEVIYFYATESEPVGATKVIVGVRDLPYATNLITEELLGSETERAKTARKDWTKRSKKIAPKDQDSKKLEFFIQRTADFDSGVGKKVDVLELTPYKPPLWIQNSTCPK